MFENDWILASLNNPTLDIDDLTSIGGLNTGNTQFLDKDLYLKSNFIKENPAFQDNFGNFSKEKFDKFYEVQASRWRDFLNNEFPTGIELDLFDTASNRTNAKIKDNNFTLGVSYNPDRVLIGIEGWRTTSKRTKSELELAQSLKIFDPETGEFENNTPEDYALFNHPIKWIENLFKEPLVLALYEEDETDEYGNKHKKGEYKLNPEGTYYYEKLNGRSPIGKTILSVADILTEEDSALNKIDFMDSDDLKKSTAGVIAKNIALIAPMFTPAAPYYYKAIIAKELTKTLPMLHSVITNLFSSEDIETPEWMNRLAAKGEALSTSNSVWSKDHTFSFENMANLISDIALQWGLLKQIAKAVTWFGDKTALKKAEELAFKLYKSKIGGSLKGMEAISDDLWKLSTLGLLCLKKYYDPVLETLKKKLRFGADLSLAYMALISNTDVYLDMLERGATKQEAAWVALGSTVGMFSVDRFAHLGEVFYDDLTAESLKLSRKVVKALFKEVAEKIYGTAKEDPIKWYKQGVELGKKAADTFVENLKDHNLGGFGKAIGEGLEEVSEELVTDLSKSIYSLLGDIGLYDKNVKDTGAFDNLLERYGMSFIGGTIGGGLFYGVEKYNGFSKARDKDMVDLIRENKALELRDVTKEYALKKKAGNTKLSGIKYSRDDAGNITWLSTSNEKESQNYYVALKVLEKINSLEAAIVGSGTKLSKDLLFDKMVLLEARYRDFKNASHITGYYDEFTKLQAEYLQAKDSYDKAAKTADGTVGGRETDSPTELEKEAKVKNLLILLTALDNALKRINDFLSGDSSLDYTRKLNFALDPVLNSVFLGLNQSEWLAERIDPNEDLPILKWIELNKEWNEHVKDVMIKDLDKAFLAYKALEKVVSPLMLALQESSNQYKSILDLLKQLLNIKESKPFYNWNSKLIDENGIEESIEEYNARNNAATPDEVTKYYKRQQRIFDLNTQIANDYIKQFDDILRPIGYSIDSATNRRLILNIGSRIKDIIKEEINYPFLESGSKVDVSPYTLILEGLKDDLSNINDVKSNLERKRYALIKDLVTNITNILNATIPEISAPISKFDIVKDDNIKKIIKKIESSNIDNKDKIIEDIKTFKETYDKANEEYSKINDEEHRAARVIARDNLYNIIPEGFRDKSIPISTIINNFSAQSAESYGLEGIEVGASITIDDFIKGLDDPDSKVYEFFSSKQSGLPEILSTAIKGIPILFGRDSKVKVLTTNSDFDVKDFVGETISRLINTLFRYTDNLSKRIQKNPIYSFYGRLKVDSHSPLEQILSSITKETSDNKEDIFNINYILNLVYKDYISIDKKDAFELNDTLAKQLYNALNSLKLLSAYVYAASVSPSGKYHFGLNKQINEFANSHKDALTKEWELLPEIDLEYAQILLDEIANLNNEIELWKYISENNSMNKIRRLVNTEKTINELNHKILKNISFKFTVGDKEYNLSEGIETLPEFDKNSENLLLQLFQIEQLIHNNFTKILKETGWTPEQFFNNTDFWKNYLKVYSDLDKQLTSKLSEYLKERTKYDEAIYLLTLLSDNPSNYYKSILNFVKDNENIIPLTILLIIARTGEAVHNSTYKAGFKALADLINPDMTLALNTAYINGTAGAGKTDVVFKIIRLRFIDLDALVIGPTASLAIKLQNSLNESTSYTIDKDSNIFSKLLLDWDKIDDAIQKGILAVNKHLDTIGYKVDNEYFTMQVYKNKWASGVKVELKLDNIKFNPDIKAPLVFVDEAAHLNTLQIALLDAYAGKVGGTLFLASDSTQSGYLNGQVENLKSSDIFTTRSSTLTESLRSSNVQKLNNDNKVKALVETINDILEAGDVYALREIASKMSNLIRGFNLRVYNQEDDINGDLIGGDIDKVIKVLATHHKDANIGFIGDANSSAYQKLKAAGFTKLGEPLTETIVPGKKFMQGQEFDYVIIDNIDLSVDLDNDKFYKKFTFLKRFRTLMSRGKVASIFLDKDLSNIIGENTLDSMKSAGFNLVNLVQSFRDFYLLQSEKLDLSQAVEEEKPKVKEEPKIKKEGIELVIHPKVENVPELNPENTEEKLKEELKSNKIEVYNDFKELNQTQLEIEISNIGELIVEANTVVPITGLRETFLNPDGTERKYSMWLPGEKTDIRRNINAIYDEDKPITKRIDKLKYLDIITKIQSSIIFGGEIKDPIFNSLFGSAWKNRKLQLEIRKATEYDNFGIGTDLKPTYIDINGEKYIISIICRLDGIRKSAKDKPFSAIFDICLLSDFNNLKNPKVQLAIKDKINRKISEGKITGESKTRAENFRDNLGDSIKEYENFIKKTLLEYPDGHVIDLSPDMYESHRTTRLVSRIVPRRLGGTLSIATVENNIVDEDGNYISDYANFIDTDKRKVVSPVYIVGKKSDLLKGKVSESIFGKAVVFVSSNTNLNSEELADLYIELKKNPDAHSPEVRMVVLNNHGLSFTELVTHRILKLLTGNETKSKKPWRMDTLGIRMFTAMWNFRAGLENFLKLLDRWKKENGYDKNNKVSDITKAESLIFNIYGKNWINHLDKNDEEILKVLKTYKITESDLKNLIKFNLEYCKNIPIFRLGFDITAKNVGGYVRQFDVSLSTIYGKNEANMLAINEEYANRYHDILTSILLQLTSNEPPEIYKKTGLGYKPMATRLVKPSGKNYETYEYIGKNEQQRNLSGLIHTNNKNIVIGETDENGKIIATSSIPAESIFSFFPKAIAAIATKSRIYQTNNNVSGLINISTIDTADKTDSFNFDISELFKDGMLERRGNDNTLFNMFNLIFHGSVESLEKGHAYIEEAPFKYGIFVDPDLEENEDYKLINVRGKNGKDYTFLKCGTSPVYFDVDVDVISGGIALKLSKIIESTKHKSNTESNTKDRLKIGDRIEILTSEGLHQEDGLYKIFKIVDTKYGRNILLLNLTKKYLVSLREKDILEKLGTKYILNSIKEEPKRYSSTIEMSDDDRNIYTNYLINHGEEDTEENYNKWKTIRNTQNLINFFHYNNSIPDLTFISLKTGLDLTKVENINGEVKYIDKDGNKGTLILDDSNTNDIIIIARPDKTNSIEEITKKSFNSMVKDYDGSDIMTHQDFINELEKAFGSENEYVQKLSNSKDIEKYLEVLEEINSNLSDKIIELELENSDKLCDYLLYVNTSC